MKIAQQALQVVFVVQHPIVFAALRSYQQSALKQKVVA